MSPTHHPCDATLISFGSGALSEGAALVVACHLSFCPECRRSVEVANSLGGVMLDEAPPTALAASRLAEVLARLDAPPARDAGPEPKGAHAWLPAPLRRYPLGRWRWIGPGIRQIAVVQRTSTGSSARLLRLAPRAALPHHGHSGDELACVLRGSFSDERGRFAIGDVSEADEHVCHRPVADPGGECVCLVATNGPLRLDGYLARLVQRFLRL